MMPILLKTLTYPGPTLEGVKRFRVTIVEGPDNGRVFEPEKGDGCAIGAAPDNEIVLRDPTVSRYHCELLRAEGGVTIRDLKSRNGTFLGASNRNGALLGAARIEHVVVPLGSRVRIGSTVFAISDSDKQSTLVGGTIEIPELVGRSTEMRAIAAMIPRLAEARLPVLITGEVGTGKHLVARVIHERSSRAKNRLVEVDCARRPESDLTIELFGDLKQKSEGAFHRAQGGTLFLDNVGELPPNLQSRVLALLERRRINRVDDRGEIPLDVRVLASANRDLRAEVNDAHFRDDLYYRLAVAKIGLPPLRERARDIPLLIRYFLEEATGDAEATAFSPEEIVELEARRWPGNALELKNFVESRVAGIVNEKTPVGASIPSVSLEPIDRYRDARAAALADFERRYLGRLIAESKGNASQAARVAGMDRPYLLSLLNRHGMR